MLGICPECKIKLKEPPFNDRNRNEVMLVLKYRGMIESRKKIRKINELGYCEICMATPRDIEYQRKMR